MGIPRWVTGMPASAAAAIAELTPGTTSKATPAAASASAFFTAAPEHERVSPFETHDAAAASRGAHHEPVDELLAHLRAARPLADEHPLRRRRQLERARIDERVVEHELRLRQTLRRLARQQIGIAGTRAHQRDETA